MYLSKWHKDKKAKEKQQWKKILNDEELENKEQKLQEEELKQVSGGGIAIRPSGNNQPQQPSDGNLL